MSDESQVVLIKIKVSEEEVKEKVLAARAALALLRKENSELDKDYKKKIITDKEYALSQQAIKTQMASATAEIKKGEKTLSDYAKTQKSAEGSLNQLRAGLALMTPAYAAMSREERTKTKAGIDLQKQIKDLSDELKKEEAAIGDNRRAVGSYAEAIEQAIAGNNTWSGRIKGTVASLSEAKDQLNSYLTGIKATTQGMSGAQKASVALGLSLKAIGIGLLLTAIAAVIGFLTRMDAGMDKIEQTTAGVSAGFEALIQTLAPLGELIVNTFTHPLDSVVSFGKALLHPIDSLKKIRSGAQDMADGVVTNVARAAAAAVEYTKAMQDIEDEQDALIGQQALVNKQVTLAQITAKDRSKSERERIKLLDEAGKVETKLSNQVVALEQRKLNALRKAQKDKKVLQDADRKAEQEAIAAVANAESDAANLQQTIQNRRAGLIEKEAADAKTAAQKAKEAAQKRAQALVDEAEAALVMQKRKGKDTIEIEQELLRRQLKLIDARVAAEKAGVEKGIGYQQKINLINQNAITERLEATKQAAIRTSEIIYNAKVTELETSLAFTARGSKAELDLTIAGIAAERNKQQEAAKATIKDKEALLKEDIRLVTTADRKINDAREAFDREAVNRQADADAQRLQLKYDLGDQTLENERELAGKRIDLEEKTQISLLDVQKKYGQVSLDDYEARLQVLQDKAKAAHKQLNDQIDSDDLQRQLTRNNTALVTATKGTKAELNAKIKQIDTQRAIDIKNARQDADQIKLINAAANKEIAESKKEYTIAAIVEVTNEVDKALGVLSTLVDGQTSAQINALDQQQAAQLASAALSAEARTKIEADFQKKKDDLEKRAAEKRRKIALAENLIATARGITESFKLPPPFSYINAALVLAQGLAQNVVIDNQKFATGGVYRSDGKGAYITGPGTGTSDSINAKISNGEAIINARSTAKYYGVLSAINSENNNGKPFAGLGAPIGRTYDVSHATPAFAYGGVMPGTDAALIADAVVKGLMGVNIRVGVDEITRAQQSVKRAEAAGDI